MVFYLLSFISCYTSVHNSVQKKQKKVGVAILCLFYDNICFSKKYWN